MGITLHTLAIGIILRVHAEKEGESTEDVTKECLSCFREKNFGKPNLSNMVLNMDRGYNSDIMTSLKLITCMNGRIEVTLKQSYQCPFTYYQRISNTNDKRLVIKTEGPFNTYRRETVINDSTREVRKMVAFCLVTPWNLSLQKTSSKIAFLVFNIRITL